METTKQVRKAAVSVIIDTKAHDERENWPPVVICGPEDDELCPGGDQGRVLLELVYDGLRVVGTLVDEGERKVIRVEVIEASDKPLARADTHGDPTLK